MIIPYTCIRCGYTSKEKPNMRRHLYERKNMCPALINDIELTEEIKKHIMLNRIYKIPILIEEKPQTPTIIKNINYNNTLNNYIGNMDTFEKLGKFMDYKQLETTSLEDSIERKFAVRIDNMKGDKFKYGYDLGNNRLFDIVDELSKIRTYSDLNIIYDDKLKELNLFKSGCWENYLVDRGLREVIDIMKDIFLDHYEKFLLLKIFVTEKNLRQKQAYKDFLLEYYKFIGSFEILPYIQDKDDCDILGDDDGDFGKYTVEEKYMPKYNEIVDNMKRYEINKTKKSVDNILKNNTKKNLKNLNKEIIDLVTSDEEFKATLEL
jgi:hypothetical protein